MCYTIVSAKALLTICKWSLFMEFKDKIRHVRKNMVFLSQAEMAEELGVAFATVNRWESGRCHPNYKAQRSFADFCKKNALNVDELDNMQ